MKIMEIAHLKTNLLPKMILKKDYYMITKTNIFYLKSNFKIYNKINTEVPIK